MLNSCLHDKLKAEAERHQMLKTVEGFLQRGFAVFVSTQLSCWKVPSTPLFGSPLPGAGERGSASERPPDPAAPGAAAPVCLGEKGRWMTLSHHGPLTNCDKSCHCRHKNAELTPPAADQNPVLTRKNPLLMKLACTLN